MRRTSVAKRIQEVIKVLRISADFLQHFRLELRVPDSLRAAADLHAVDNQVVGQGRHHEWAPKEHPCRILRYIRERMVHWFEFTDHVAFLQKREVSDPYRSEISSRADAAQFGNGNPNCAQELEDILLLAVGYNDQVARLSTVQRGEYLLDHLFLENGFEVLVQRVYALVGEHSQCGWRLGLHFRDDFVHLVLKVFRVAALQQDTAVQNGCSFSGFDLVLQATTQANNCTLEIQKFSLSEE